MIDEVRVAPSILAADFSRLGEQIGQVMDAGARVIHVDVMDGHFVPPISIGAVVVESIREQVKAAGGWLDVHLMVERPERHVEAFAAAGADSISVHVEATPHVHYALKAVREAGCKAGLALNPGTPAHEVEPLVGSLRPPALHDGQPRLGRPGVHRGLGGEGPGAAGRWSARASPIEVDGGIDPDTAGPVRRGRRDPVRGGLVDLRRARPGATPTADDRHRRRTPAS